MTPGGILCAITLIKVPTGVIVINGNLGSTEDSEHHPHDDQTEQQESSIIMAQIKENVNT